MTKAERLELIREIGNKINRRKALMAKIGPSSIGKLKLAAREQFKERAEKEQAYSNRIAKMDENHLHWTDNEKYVANHYGDVYAETTKFDKEWD